MCFFFHACAGLPKPVDVRISGRTNASLAVSWNYPTPPIGTVIRNFLVRLSGYACACGMFA